MNQLTNTLLSEIMSESSGDPFLMLVTLSHDSFGDMRFVNNSVDVFSNGNTFQAFPMKIRLPVDDGESVRDVSIDFDNAGLTLISAIRSVTSQISVKLEMILASSPDDIQVSLEELKIQSVSYNKSKVSCKLVLDNFLNTNMTSEQYNPTNFPGLF